MSDRLCGICGTLISGLRCEPCVASINARHLRQPSTRKKRRKKPPTPTSETASCEDCGGPFVRSCGGGNRAKYCPPCRHQRRLDGITKCWATIERDPAVITIAPCPMCHGTGKLVTN